MPNLKSYIRNTLSVHLSLWMAAIAALLFMAVLWMMLWFARQAIREEAIEKAKAALETAALNIDNELSKVETAARALRHPRALQRPFAVSHGAPRRCTSLEMRQEVELPAPPPSRLNRRRK